MSSEEDLSKSDHGGAKRAITEKLRLLKSPLVSIEDSPHSYESPLPDLSQYGKRPGVLADMPEFKRHEDASLLELFFDLFFAANYTVFSQTQAMTSREAIAAYVGYFTVLWISWFLVGLYDVRFVTDSFFERAARGVHLGVMVGFAVVAPDFDPSDQNVRTMRTMSLILMVSRLCLAIEYGSILWHVRKFPKARVPLLIQIALTLIPAIIYLGIAFRFDEGGSRVFVTWYVVAGLEALATVVVSNFWEVLRFTKTHLMKRMSLLTVIILGDGIIVVAQNVVKIVEGPHAWNSTIIGIVTAATATVYIIFLVYFDWMKYTHLPAWRQQLWTCLHFPFHLSLTVFMTAFTQFILWSKITNASLAIDPLELLDVEAWPSATSEDVHKHVSSFTDDYFKLYPPTWSEAWTTIEVAVANLTEIPDDFWGNFYNGMFTGDYSQVDYDAVVSFETALLAIMTTMANSLFQTFGFDINEELREMKPQDESGSDVFNGHFQTQNFNEIWARYELIFALGYIAAGVVLFLMTLLTITTHITPWRPWSIIRTIIMLLLSIGLGSISTIYYNFNHKSNYLNSPWLLPTITLAWLIVLVLAHAHNFPDPRKGSKAGGVKFFNWPKVYEAIEGRGVRRTTYQPESDGTVVMMNERVGEHRAGEGRLPRRDSFYDQVGFDGTAYGGYRSQVQGLGVQQPTAYEPSYEPFREEPKGHR